MMASDIEYESVPDRDFEVSKIESLVDKELFYNLRDVCKRIAKR